MQLKKLKTSLIKSLRTGKLFIRIIITIIILRIIYQYFKWIGLKGLLAMIIGMAVMTAIIIHPKTSNMTMFIVKALRGEENLINYMKK